MTHFSRFIFGASLLILSCAFPVFAKYTIAIDAGHGGKDPGAVGPYSLYEKNITLSIAKKLAGLLTQNNEFNVIMTRNRDIFISVSERSEIARKGKANLLVSIHADAAPTANAKGASVWVLSTKRADSELGQWLEQSEKQSELLGGAGEALANEENRYLSQAVLDLQFAYAQRVGYELAQTLIGQLRQITRLAKSSPASASLGVLRSPDIPSVLVEVGFITNRVEAEQLKSNAFQDKIAQALYQGIKNYVKQNPL